MVQITPRMFFTAEPVRRAVDKATRSVLSKAGAFVRQRARTLIRPRPRGRSARPGEPPSSHTGLLRRLIYFGYDPRNQSVVVGPTPLNQRSPYGPTTVPQVLEEGGRVVAKSTRRRKTRVLNFRGNPYMGPALRAELPRLPKLWTNSVVPGGRS